jgi:hypothetical protein
MNLSAGPTRSRALQSATTFATLAWLIMTPFGSPVVPDVYST